MAAETFHNLIQGQSALFQKKEQEIREIMAIFRLNYLNQVQIAANTLSRNRAKSIIQRFHRNRLPQPAGKINEEKNIMQG